MKTYICKLPVELSRKDFDKINKLFKVDFNDESPEMEVLIDELDARPDTSYATFWWDFENGLQIRLEIESDDNCYMDNTYLYDPADDEDYAVFDREFRIDEEMVVTCINAGDDCVEQYICKIIIKEDK